MPRPYDDMDYEIARDLKMDDEESDYQSWLKDQEDYDEDDENARDAYEDHLEYEKDEYAYYGVSRSDF